ncbi:endospore germination permease [Shimazuella sp. AN120528]|uniref:GerAB/ArcD/ProY family transporter n=1 Tax=Shimazuella soli TaxID=1892854 RepID=UPI001F1104ED|nr:endospore germination permease [Shimazuella soli]MCH5584442.1 endospore germination permease [Shimazuella soli]
MIKKEKIEATQFQKMISIYIIGTSIILIPSLLTAEAKQNAWISAIVGMGAGLLLVWLYNVLASVFPGKTLVESSKEILGKGLGTLLSVLFFSFSLIINTLVLRNLGDFLTSSMFPETPIPAIHIVYLFIVVIGVRYGISNIARTSEWFFPWIILLFSIFVLFLIPDLEWRHIQPILAKGIKSVLRSSFPYIGFPFLELILFLMVFPNVENPKKAGKAFLVGTLIGGTVLFTITLISILVLGAESSASNIYASFELAKKIEIGEFIQRVEVIIALIWFITIYFKITFCFYIMVLCLSQTLNLSDYRPLTLPMAMILLPLSIIIVPNLSYLISFDTNVWPLYALTFGFIFPLLLLGVALIKKKFVKQNSS